MKLVVSFSICMLFVMAGCSVAGLDENKQAGDQTEVSVPSADDALQPKSIRPNVNDRTFSTASEIQPNSGIQGRTFEYYHTAWIKFSAVAGRSYKIQTWVYDACDTVLYLYSSANVDEPLQYNDDRYYVSSEDKDYGSEIKWNCPTTGTYYIKCRSYNNVYNQDLWYDLSVRDNTVPGDNYEYDNDMNKATRISTTGESQLHDFSDGTDDWVKMYLEEGYQYIIETKVTGICDTFVGLYVRGVFPYPPTMEVYNDNKAEGDRGSKLVYTAKYTGYHHLFMFSPYYGQNYWEGTYSLSVTRAAYKL